MKLSKIPYAHATFSPWWGCSMGCPYCYAAGIAKRYSEATYGPGAKFKKIESCWPRAQALNLRAEKEGKQFIIFPSMCDWLDPHVPDQWFYDFVGLMVETRHLFWLNFTKLPEIFGERLQAIGMYAWPLENCMTVASITNQADADERIPHLLKIPGKLGVSCAPLTGPIKLGISDLRLSWVAIEGMSGKNAAPCNIEWIRDIISQCRAAGVKVFLKQLGSTIRTSASIGGWPDKKDKIFRRMTFSGSTGTYHCKVKHRSGADPSEWPDDLRVRELPV